MRSEVFITMTIHIVVFWTATPCSDVIGYRHFREPYCLHLEGILPYYYMVSQPGRPWLQQLQTTTLIVFSWDFQISIILQ